MNGDGDKYLEIPPDIMWDVAPPAMNLPPIRFMFYAVNMHEARERIMSAEDADDIMRWWMEWWKYTVLLLRAGDDRGAIVRVDYDQIDDGTRIVTVTGLVKVTNASRVEAMRGRVNKIPLPLANDLPTWDSQDEWKAWDVYDTGCQTNHCAMSAMRGGARAELAEGLWHWLRCVDWSKTALEADWQVRQTLYGWGGDRVDYIKRPAEGKD